MTYKAVYGQLSDYMQSLMQVKKKSAHNLRSNNELLLAPRTLNQTRQQETELFKWHLLNFRKFEVALNPMYRIFLNIAKSCVLSCLSKVDNIKNFTVKFMNYKSLKV